MTEGHHPLISVIIPAYNAEASIRRTIESVLRQTHANLEVIVVDDGSSDDTARIVEELADGDNRIRLLRQSNRGVSHARNQGIACSRGQYLAPLDADDLWHHTKLAKQLECFDKEAEVSGVVYCFFAVIDESDNVTFPRTVYHTPTGHVYPQLAVGNIVGNASSPLIRRTEVEKVGGYDDEFQDGCEDLDFYLRLAEVCDFSVVPEFLVGYRRSRESMSMNIPKMEQAITQLTRKMLSRHPKLPRKLLSWRNGNMYRYLSLHAHLAHEHRLSIVLAAKSVLSDPLLLWSWILARAVPGQENSIEPLQTSRYKFSDADPIPGVGENLRPTALELRRHVALASMRFARLSVQNQAPCVDRPVLRRI